MLDLRRLRLLREVHGRGTVHAAARALGYTPSAVSQQLAVLEREVGTPLLERVGRGVRLTEAGVALVGHADVLLDGAEAAVADVAAVAAGRLAGTVRVAAFQSALLHLVVPAVQRLAADHPGIRVEVAEAEVEQAVPALRLQHLDLLVGDEYDGHPRPVHRELRREPLLRERLAVVLPAGHPEGRRQRVRLAALADLPWAACQPGTGQHEVHVRLCREVGGFEPDVRYASDDFGTLLALVREVGAGALLPGLALRSDPRGVVVRPLVRADPGREVFVTTRRSRPPAVAAVEAALAAAAGEVSAAAT